MTTKVYAALRAKFAPPTYAMVTEVGNSTGVNCRRWADAVAMSVWPSRGLEIHGVEVKVSRADWLKELADPDKAESICRFCDRWWLAVSDPSIVKPGELPPTWGLLAMRGDRLVTVTAATKLEAEPVSRGFLASLLRKSIEQQASKVELAAEYQRGVAEGKESASFGLKHANDKLSDLAKKVREFEQASGVRMHDAWNAGHIGEAVRMIVRNETPFDVAYRALQAVDRAAETLRKMVAMEGNHVDERPVQLFDGAATASA